MNLDELRSVQSKERKKDSLQNLRPSFYQEVGEYIADLEDERERVADQVADPFSSPEVGRLTDEIETAKDVVEAIYERRMGKLVKQASLAAAGMAANDEGLTAEEADLFDDLVDRIGANKSRVLDVLEGIDTETGAETGTVDGATAGTAPAGVDTRDSAVESEIRDSSDPVPDDRVEDDPADEPAPPAAPDDTPPVPPQEPADAAPAADGPTVEPESEPDGSSGVTPADVMGGNGPTIDDASPEPPEPPADDPPSPPTDEPASDSSVDDTSAVDRVTVKITQDIGSILGVDDREYTLSTDDVVTLPAQNATPLVERDAAEPLE
ncbi:DNA replication complex subunit Gins51 [Natronorubrum sulfidifaciens]|uniref:Uncharacterized protein n=1 Tax=Natronorubrum sulfidifaciens JCM 14089 TaxID=1230460 RepID=L9WFD5_9EURY|nr:hypothetical protein [Natronorubrum sulfidifaciens]ELY48179.1 hypothetical protein C495_01855 [Natronorubrum sulfidifaciens JCM 14089]